MGATPGRRDQTPRITPKGAETGSHPRTKPFGPQTQAWPSGPPLPITQAPRLTPPSHCLQAVDRPGQKPCGQHLWPGGDTPFPPRCPSLCLGLPLHGHGKPRPSPTTSTLSVCSPECGTPNGQAWPLVSVTQLTTSVPGHWDLVLLHIWVPPNQHRSESWPGQEQVWPSIKLCSDSGKLPKTQTGSFHFQDLGVTCKGRKSGHCPTEPPARLPTQGSLEGRGEEGQGSPPPGPTPGVSSQGGPQGD